MTLEERVERLEKIFFYGEDDGWKSVMVEMSKKSWEIEKALAAANQRAKEYFDAWTKAKQELREAQGKLDRIEGRL